MCIYFSLTQCYAWEKKQSWILNISLELDLDAFPKVLMIKPRTIHSYSTVLVGIQWFHSRSTAVPGKTLIFCCIIIIKYIKLNLKSRKDPKNNLFLQCPKVWTCFSCTCKKKILSTECRELTTANCAFCHQINCWSTHSITLPSMFSPPNGIHRDADAT